MSWKTRKAGGINQLCPRAREPGELMAKGQQKTNVPAQAKSKFAFFCSTLFVLFRPSVNLEHSLSLTWEVTQLDLSFRKSPRFFAEWRGNGWGGGEGAMYIQFWSLPPSCLQALAAWRKPEAAGGRGWARRQDRRGWEGPRIPLAFAFTNRRLAVPFTVVKEQMHRRKERMLFEGVC